MDANNIPDWETFEQELRKLRAQYGTKSSPLLFRGQGNSKWPLMTTLERNGRRGMLFGDYYRLICSGVGSAVGTFTDAIVPEYRAEVWESFSSDRELLSMRRFPPLDLYRYMVYLRHHGFPSPLLDWSRSPYVAAFFAFREPADDTESRSIWAYCEMPEGHKGGAVGEPTIQPLGSNVRTHRRHFLQRSDYTICGALDLKNRWCFDSHQKVSSNRRPGQDFLWKYDLPSTERPKVLRLLDDYNLNAFSLFDSDESLLETMWLRECALKEKAPDSAEARRNRS